MSLSNPAEQKMKKKTSAEKRKKKDLNNKCTDKTYVARNQRCEKWHRNIVAATIKALTLPDQCTHLHFSTFKYATPHK